VLILALAKRLTEQDRLVRQGRWDLQPQVMGSDLPGMTLGIIGFGHSGRELARLIAPFRMRLIAYSPNADPKQAAELNVRLVPSMDDLLRQSDFVSLHCRLLPTNHGLIGERELRLMKPTAYFVNVARGELVQQEVLVRCLKEKWIAGAGLDVYVQEPLPVGDPLLQLDNVILTPHWLPATRQAARATMEQMARGMLRAAHGLVPENIINPSVLERPLFKEKLGRFRAG
jgi:phosphoglycerate dehydrogenase-like enzyme